VRFLSRALANPFATGRLPIALTSCKRSLAAPSTGPERLKIGGAQMMAKAGNSLNRSATHLLHRAGQRAADIYADEVRGGGLTPRQFAVLTAVSQQEGLTQTDLVERTGIDRSTLADIVARLLSRGLIQRRRAKDDGRAYAIKLSGQGAKALRDAQPAAAAADTRLLASLPPAKRQDFLESLNLIVGESDD
jgi:DNA-binding MarR family transcriptional regulator